MSVHADKIGGVLIVECEGSIADADAAARLRDVVTSEDGARIIVIDLSKVDYVAGAGLAMLAFLQRWAHENVVQLKLFNPSRFVRHLLKQAGSMFQFDFASLEETMALLTRADSELQHGRDSQFQHST